ADNGSMYNTPPTWAWYLADLVFDWIAEQGGVQAMEKHNAAKADALYACIDANPFYRNPIAKPFRSRMNVPFRLHDEALNDKFLQESEAAGMLALAGHRSVGGMRASIYNAMPMAGVQTLIEFMTDFAKRNG
ncbi:MAG TPA: aminotransferase class V-fold PLP-dependent enzyme, partial [Permianibacter sp.]|nr:aminotransferase class V-fold PLP-dependent enzyme [Permianibacter sp.]